MTDRPPTRGSGPVRAIRRWMRDTPNGPSAAAMIIVGVLLVVLASLLAAFAL